MQVRLTDRDMKRVNLAQKYFSQMQPVPIQMGSADVVRVALSQLLQKLAQADTEISNALFELETEEGQHPMKRVRRRLNGLMPSQADHA